MHITEISPGMKVHYATAFKKENGIVKSIRQNQVFVVYHCDDDWDNYQDYTAANTPVEDLYPGWLPEDKLVTN